MIKQRHEHKKLITFQFMNQSIQRRGINEDITYFKSAAMLLTSEHAN